MKFEDIVDSFCSYNYEVQLMHDVKEGKIDLEQWYELVDLRRKYDEEHGI